MVLIYMNSNAKSMSEKKIPGLTEMRFHLGAWEPDSVLLS